MKKILIKSIILSLIVIMTLLSVLKINSYAVSEIKADETNLYSIGSCEKYLKFKGKPITTTYVVYNSQNGEYPAYCLNVDLPGVGEVGSYNVSTTDKITDVGLWRVIINGYPYKTIEELGVDTKEEAYTATKQAIYCYLYNRGTEDYASNGEKGIKTLQALNKILENASKETLSQVANNVTISTNCNSWEEDSINKNYVSKTYQVKADASINNYKITASENFAEGAIITDSSNNVKNTFNEGEEFKVLIPIRSLRNDGTFSLKVETQMNTKPVIYGKKLLEGVQDYALTAYSYENAIGEYEEKYEKNQTKIKIIKKDKDTQELLSSVVFEVLDSEKNVVYSNLVTNENGEILIENIMPGKYYLKEVNGLQGYIDYEELIEVQTKFNHAITVTVNNTKEPTKPQEKPNEEKITVENNAKPVEVVQPKRLPVTGM